MGLSEKHIDIGESKRTLVVDVDIGLVLKVRLVRFVSIFKREPEVSAADGKELHRGIDRSSVSVSEKRDSVCIRLDLIGVFLGIKKVAVRTVRQTDRDLKSLASLCRGIRDDLRLVAVFLLDKGLKKTCSILLFRRRVYRNNDHGLRKILRICAVFVCADICKTGIDRKIDVSAAGTASGSADLRKVSVRRFSVSQHALGEFFHFI